jgi:hypothetical protein
VAGVLLRKEQDFGLVQNTMLFVECSLRARSRSSYLHHGVFLAALCRCQRSMRTKMTCKITVVSSPGPELRNGESLAAILLMAVRIANGLS